MYVRKDGSLLYFDTSKCQRNFLKLRREPRRVLWTEKGREEKKQRLKYLKDTAPPPPPEPPKQPEEEKVEEKEQPEEAEKTEETSG